MSKKFELIANFWCKNSKIDGHLLLNKKVCWLNLHFSLSPGKVTLAMVFKLTRCSVSTNEVVVVDAIDKLVEEFSTTSAGFTSSSSDVEISFPFPLICGSTSSGSSFFARYYQICPIFLYFCSIFLYYFSQEVVHRLISIMSLILNLWHHRCPLWVGICGLIHWCLLLRFETNEKA